jgi:hypothetical protein
MQKVCKIIGATPASRSHHGRTAFSILTVLFMLSFFHRVAPGAIAGEFQQAFAVGGAALGALVGTYFYVYFVMQIPTGVLADMQPLIGWILDRGWQGASEGGIRLYSAGDFRLGIALLFGLTVTGLLVSLLIRETDCRNIHDLAPRQR